MIKKTNIVLRHHIVIIIKSRIQFNGLMNWTPTGWVLISALQGFTLDKFEIGI